MKFLVTALLATVGVSLCWFLSTQSKSHKNVAFLLYAAAVTTLIVLMQLKNTL